MFQKHTRYFITYVTKGVLSSLHFNNIGVYFQREDRKRTLTANTRRSNSCSMRRNMQWCYCLRFHLGFSIQI